MNIPGHFARRLLGAAALLFGLAFAGGAQAVPVYTYTFTHTGYHPASPDLIQDPGTVTGSFSGTLDSTGHITRATLTAYHFEIGGFGSTALDLFQWSHNKQPYYFSYIPGDTGSFALVDHGKTLGIQAIDVCIGLPTGITCNAGGARGAAVMASGGTGSPVDHSWIVFAITDATPVLVGSVVDIGDPVYLATTPIPAPLLMFVTGLGALLFLGIRRRHRQFGAAVA